MPLKGRQSFRAPGTQNPRDSGANPADPYRRRDHDAGIAIAVDFPDDSVYPYAFGMAVGLPPGQIPHVE